MYIILKMSAFYKKLLIFFLLIFFVNCLLSAQALPTNIAPPVVDTRQFSESYSSLLLRTVIMLAFFIGVIWLLYRFSRRKNTGISDQNIIEDLFTCYLGSSRALKIIRVINEYYLVGVTDANINMIAVISDKESIDKIKLEYNQKPETYNRNFLAVLAGYFPGIIKNSTLEVTRNLKDRLKKI